NRPQDRRRDAKLQDVDADRNKWVLRGPAAPDHSDANDWQRESDHADQPTKVGLGRTLTWIIARERTAIVGNALSHSDRVSAYSTSPSSAPSIVSGHES